MYLFITYNNKCIICVEDNGIGASDEQIEKLKKIGIERQVNDRFEKQWLTRYEELRSFIAENGRMPLTRKIKGSENSIAVWLNSQKKKYKNGQMSDKHIEMLEALKVDLDPEKICR